jgi:glycerol-3-phosphate O-acyltransferase
MRVLRFWRDLQKMDSRIHMQFGEPLDLFGNRVDEDGVSRDAHGRPVDRSKYVEVDGRPRHDAQRDQEYTRELGQAILQSFRRNNVAMSTHAAAFAAFAALRRRHPQYDLYRALRTAGPEQAVPRAEILVDLGVLLERLRALARKGGIVLAPDLERATAGETLAKALEHFASFHEGEALKEGPEGIYTENMKLLYYYRNRLAHYGLEESLEGERGKEKA